MRSNTFSVLLGILGLLLLVALKPGAAESAEALPPKPLISLTLIPPSPVTDQITLDLRGAVRNLGSDPQTYDVAIYLDREEAGSLLHRERLQTAPGEAKGLRFSWPTKGKVGKHRVILAAHGGGATFRAERPLGVLATGQRSTGRLGGAWVDIYHHDEREGKPFNAELGKMTDAEWRELVRAMHDVDQDILVITMMFQNFTHRGRHKIETEGYQGKAYYPSQLFPGRMPIASQDPLEAILSEADRLGMHVMPGVGCYAFFDYTPGSLRWCKQVADELWRRYGHHPSFYGWYLSHEKDGGLGNAAEREEIAQFFREFTPYAHRLAPDKPVMLATNCYHLRGAEEAYRKLLPHLDIICPFAFHRMPGGDLTGEEAATLMQSLCDAAGCHLWMDVESFEFADGGGLVPRSIEGLISDFTRFPNFEKSLHYQFPGLMSGPGMSRQPGGPASAALYEDYRQYLEALRQGAWPSRFTNAAQGKPVTLATPPDDRYPGAGTQGLVDAQPASPDYRDRRWMGFFGSDLEAVIDLGASTELAELGVRCLQFTAAGIYLPQDVRFAVSEDGKNYVEAAAVGPRLAPNRRGPAIETLAAGHLEVRGRFVRVRAKNFGVLPPDHQAAGVKAWLFVDQLKVVETTTTSEAQP